MVYVDTPCYTGKVKCCVTDDPVSDLTPGNLPEAEQREKGGGGGGGEKMKVSSFYVVCLAHALSC